MSLPRILIVEDNAIIALDLQQILEDLGLDVTGVSTDAEGALQLIAEQSFDLAVIDYMLAEGTADAVVAALKAAGTPILICTGMLPANGQDGFRGMPVLLKPFRTEHVRAAVANLIGNGASGAPAHVSP